MEASPVYILIALIVFLILGFFVFFVKRKKKREGISVLGSLGLILVLMGILFGNYRIVGYGFIGGGVLLAVIDIILKFKNKKRK